MDLSKQIEAYDNDELKEDLTFDWTVPIVIEDDRIIYNSMQLSPESASDFAKKDDFSSTDDFINFFRQQYGLPFKGVLIQW